MFVVVVGGNLMILGGKSDDFRGECFIGSGGMDAPGDRKRPPYKERVRKDTLA